MTRFDTRVAKDLTKTEWLTPPYILEALRKYGEFDLDPCAPVNARGVIVRPASVGGLR